MGLSGPLILGAFQGMGCFPERGGPQKEIPLEIGGAVVGAIVLSAEKGLVSRFFAYEWNSGEGCKERLTELLVAHLPGRTKRGAHPNGRKEMRARALL